MLKRRPPLGSSATLKIKRIIDLRSEIEAVFSDARMTQAARPQTPTGLGLV
jgi:hypothetical protein